MTVYVVQQPLRRVTEQDVRRFPSRYRPEHVGTLVPAFDVSPAAKYGDIKLLLDSSLVVGIAMAPLVRTFRQKLAAYGDDDYILPTGDPAAMGIAIAIAAQANQGRVKLLRWDRKSGGYIELAVEI